MVKVKRYLVLGAFGFDTDQLDGQTVKTRNVYDLLVRNNAGVVDCVDTMHIRRRPLSIFRFIWYLIRCNTLIIVPCLNNLTYIFPVTYWLSKIFRYKIVHVCIGGWQLEYFQGNSRFRPHPLQLKLSKKISAFLPEMQRVESDLRNELGFTNVMALSNFRFISEDAEQIVTSSHALRLVFLARVDRGKGYETIFNFAELVKKDNIDILIDFYGPINEADKEDFLSKVDKYHGIVSYKGVLQQNEVTGCLENYDIMLLPTTIYTEGFPGSILDAYIAGIPVIATEWKHSREFIDDGETGFIVPFIDCQADFNDRIMTLYNDRNLLQKMKRLSFRKRLLYSDKYAWSILSRYL